MFQQSYFIHRDNQPHEDVYNSSPVHSRYLLGKSTCKPHTPNRLFRQDLAFYINPRGYTCTNPYRFS